MFYSLYRCNWLYFFALLVPFCCSGCLLLLPFVLLFRCLVACCLLPAALLPAALAVPAAAPIV
jgi:hypothetical protein